MIVAADKYRAPTPIFSHLKSGVVQGRDACQRLGIAACALLGATLHVLKAEMGYLSAVLFQSAVQHVEQAIGPILYAPLVRAQYVRGCLRQAFQPEHAR